MPGPGRRPRVAGAGRRAQAAPVESVPVESVSVESVPVESVSVVPVCVESVSVESVSVEPVSVESVPVEARPSGLGEPVPLEPDLLVVGRIGKPQGIRGEVTVQVRTDDPGARFADGAVLLTDPAERGPLTVSAARDQNGRLMVLFEGVSDRNGAEALRGTLLLVDAATLPPPDDPDEFHDFQLVGLAAELPDGSPLGVVVEVLHLPHGDVLVVRRPAVGESPVPELLVPFVAAMVPVVDVPGGRVVVDPPDGLLDLGHSIAADAGAGPPAGPAADAGPAEQG